MYLDKLKILKTTIEPYPTRAVFANFWAHNVVINN